MEMNEAKELLPFYVNGTLGPSEKEMVEELLKDSPELREQFSFWQNASAAIRAAEAPVRAGHVSGTQVVDFAMGNLAAEERASVERHLQSCVRCSEEYSLVKSSISSQTIVEPTIAERIMGAIRSVKLVYAVPALTAMIAAVIIYVGKKEEDSPSASKQVTEAPATVKLPEVYVVDEVVNLFLTYQPQMRSIEKKKRQTLLLSEEHKQIRIFVAVPHNAVKGIRYKMKIALVGRKSIELPDVVERYAFSATHDSLQFTLARRFVPPTTDTANILVFEVLPPALSDLTPEVYRFSVTLIQKNSR
jgi:hypothetical protein